MHGAFFLLQAPASGVVRQIKQGRQRSKCKVQQHKGGDQAEQHQVHRQIDAIGLPKNSHRALVATRHKCSGHCHTKQRHQPQSASHINAPLRLW